MALIGKIREKSGLTLGIVGLGVVLFLVGRELLSLVPAGGKRNPAVGKVAGKAITLKAFQDQLEQLQHNFAAQYGRTPAESESRYLKDQAWQSLVETVIYEKLRNKLGLKVSEEELVDLVQGDHIHPDLQLVFTNQATRTFDKDQLLAYLQKLAQLPAAQQAHWHDIERTLANSRCQTKFEQLMKHSIFITDLEAQKKYELAHTQLELQGVTIPYDSLPAEKDRITDAMLQAYLKTHQKAYQVEERRDIVYVHFPIIPTEEDQRALQEELQTIKQGFIQAQDDRAFASIHTEEENGLAYDTFTAEELPKALTQQPEPLKKGLVIGPVGEDSWYKLYKILAVPGEKDQKYEVAIIAKSLSPGDEARERAFKQADAFAGLVSNREKFEKQANQDNLTIHTAQLQQNDAQVGMLAQARELVRWIYQEGKVGKVSPVFELANDYVVAVMTEQVKPGLADFKKVKEELYKKVLHEQQAQQLQAQLATQNELSLATLAEQYGVQVWTAQQVKFSQNSLPGMGRVPKAIGQAFALQKGQKSQPVAENSGVVLVELVEKHAAPSTEDLAGYRADQLQFEQFKLYYDLAKSLEALANTQDFRYKYY